GRPLCAPSAGGACPSFRSAPDQGPGGEGFARPHRRGFVLRDRRRAADALPRRAEARAAVVARRKDTKGTGQTTIPFPDLAPSVAPDLLRPAPDEAGLRGGGRKNRGTAGR